MFLPGALKTTPEPISARALASRETELKLNTPIYYGVFDGEIPGWDHPGTFHSVDLWFYFETLAKCWRPFTGKHLDLARNMCNYWANFIRTGDPNGIDSTGEAMPQWDPYTLAAPYGMVFADKAEFVKEQPSDLMNFLVKEYFKNLHIYYICKCLYNLLFANNKLYLQ
jgi:para-nitrobenzyl esterase